MQTLYTDSNSTIMLTKVVEQPDGTPVTGATVTFTLYDRDGLPVNGQGWPLTLIDTTEPGNYSGTLDETIELKHNWEYRGVCEAVSLSGQKLSIKCPMIAKDRDCCE
jgi:hypothetical protein